MLIPGNIVPCILKTRGLIYSWFKLVELQDCVSPHSNEFESFYEIHGRLEQAITWCR